MVGVSSFIFAVAECCVHPISVRPVIVHWRPRPSVGIVLGTLPPSASTDNAPTVLRFMAMEPCTRRGVQKGLVPWLIHQTSLTFPRRRVLYSIYLSINPITPRYIFPLNSSFAASIFILSLLPAIQRCQSTCIHYPSPSATTRCPTRLRTPNPPHRLPALLRLRSAAGHLRALISSASLAHLRHTSKMQIA